MKYCTNSFLKSSNLLVKNLFNEGNRSKIINVLKGDFKPLFGIDSFLYIRGHRHVGRPMHSTLKDMASRLFLEDTNPIILVNDIRELVTTPSFKQQLRIYIKDFNYILSLVRNGQITTLGSENTNEGISSMINPEGCPIFDKIASRLTSFGLDGQSVNEFLLVLFGPEIYLYAGHKLPNIQFVGVEGETYKKVIEDFSTVFHMFKNGDKTWKLLSKKCFERSEQRNKEIAQYLEETLSGSKTLLVIGNGHAKGIKQLMSKNWKVKITSNT